MREINSITEEARRQGFQVEPIEEFSGSGLGRKRLLIEGRRCQIIPARSFKSNRDYPKRESIQLYLPRTSWPDFLIYVVKQRADSDKLGLYIMPRGDLSADTARSLSSLKRFENAWHFLGADLPDEKFARHFRELSFSLKIVQDAAKRNGFSVSLVKRGGWSRVPDMFQHRILIHGRRCQVMSASRCSSDSDDPSWNTVRIKMPKEPWGGFVIYVVNPPEEDVSQIFVIPRCDISKTTTRSLLGDWLNHYYEAWQLLGTGKKASL